MPENPHEIYQQRCASFGQQRDHHSQRWDRVANLRLALFVAALGAITTGLWMTIGWLLGLGLVLTSGFIAALIYHTRIERQRDRYAGLLRINDHGLKRLRRDWASLPLRQATTPVPPDSYAADLDVLGHASLIHLLGTPSTPGGQAALQAWLLAPAPPAEIQARQIAVAELAPLVDLRDELALDGQRSAPTAEQYALFLAWARTGDWLLNRQWLLWLSRITPLLLIGLIVAENSGLLTTTLWPFVLMFNVILSVTAGSRANQLINEVANRQELFGAYATIFRLIGLQPWRAPALKAIQQRLSAGDRRADQQMDRLRRIMALADMRMSMLYGVLQVFTLWGFHVLWLLERWRRTSGTHVGDWLAALSELEALAALATLHHDQPAWVFPELTSGQAPKISAEALGHPLLRPEECRTNSVELGPPGTFLLVTGSNMSGKSTLLRALGLNVALAQAGGPVCAARLSLPPLRLATSMRVQDSLEQGVSYFMAEVRRLKLVIDLAEAASQPGEPTLLYLLDEILHGTNTVERQIAARQMVGYLLRHGALGAVSTHDLALAEDPDLKSASQPVYFTETFTRGPDGPRMTFDYTLRPGIATSTNALKLMELIGLPVGAEEIGSRK